MAAPDGLPAPLRGVLTRYQGSPKDGGSKRKPGRPTKRTSEYLRALARDYEERCAQFESKHGRRPSSVRQLYTEVFAEQFESSGERASRASTPDFQRALKTLRNELAEARRLARANPGNLPISGTAQCIS